MVAMADIQVRSVDEQMARRAKARAAETRRSLSDYVKDLIPRDLETTQRGEQMRCLLQEIGEDQQAPVDRAQTSSALADVRREMGTG